MVQTFGASKLESIMDDAHVHPESVDPALASLLVTRLQYRRRLAQSLGSWMRQKKRTYDEQGPSRKLPFALERFLNDRKALHWIYSQCYSLATTHGCTGACRWCAVGAFTVGIGGVEQIPFEQKKALWDDIISSAGGKADKYLRIPGRENESSNFFHYADTDPFDDPDLPELMEYLSRNYGGTPYLSTVIPNNSFAFDHLKQLTHKAWLTKQLSWIKKIRTEFNELLDASSFFDDCDTIDEIIVRLDEACEKINVHPLGKLAESLINKFGCINPIAFEDISYDDDLAGQEKCALDIKFLNSLRIEAGVEDKIAEFTPPKLSGNHLLSLYQEIKKSISVQTETSQIKAALRIESIWTTLEISMIQFLAEQGKLKAPGWSPNGDIKYMNQMLAMEQEDLEKRLGGFHVTGLIRISHTTQRDAELRELSDGPYEFYTASRKAEDGFSPFLAGQMLRRQKEIERSDSWGVHCISGVTINPYGVFNSVGGRPTQEFPNGSILVPFEGFESDAPLSIQGSPLGMLLMHSICIKTPHRGESNGYEEIFIYDGSRIRQIIFDSETFTIKRDTIVQDHVETPDEITVAYPQPYLRRQRFERLIVRYFDTLPDFAIGDQTKNQLDILKCAATNGVPIALVSDVPIPIEAISKLEKAWGIKISCYQEMSEALESELNQASTPDGVIVLDHISSPERMEEIRSKGAFALCCSSQQATRRQAHAWLSPTHPLGRSMEVEKFSDHLEILVRS